jgi:hypothetical protein
MSVRFLKKPAEMRTCTRRGQKSCLLSSFELCGERAWSSPRKRLPRKCSCLSESFAPTRTTTGLGTCLTLVEDGHDRRHTEPQGLSFSAFQLALSPFRDRPRPQRLQATPSLNLHYSIISCSVLEFAIAATPPSFPSVKPADGLGNWVMVTYPKRPQRLSTAALPNQCSYMLGFIPC